MEYKNSRYRFGHRAADVIIPCRRRWSMTRKDSEKETDRPHYYSQFWLDVAAGRTVIGAPKAEDEEDLAEDELDIPEPEPTPMRRVGRNNAASNSDGYNATRIQTVAEPEFETEESEKNEADEFDLTNDVVDLELPDNVIDETAEDTVLPESEIIPSLDEDEEIEEEEEDHFYDEGEGEEEEEDDDWSARGRKKPKPGRQVKPLKLPKKPKREPRRGF
jgi:hypothetical protein